MPLPLLPLPARLPLPVRIALTLLDRPARHRLGPDPSQVADLHLPTGRGPFPVAVLLHGGYWQSRYGKLIMRPLARDLVGSGYAVWNLEYRRLPALDAPTGPLAGVVARLTGSGAGGGWPMTFADVAAGIDALAGLDAPLDLARVDVVGHSAGGQLALWAARRSVLPAGTVGAAPVVGVRRVVALAPVTRLDRAQPHADRLLGGGVDDVPDRWAQADPVRAGVPPVPAVVVHPSEDETVPVKRSREWCAATGVPLVERPGLHRDPIDPTHPLWHAARAWLAASD